MKRFSAILILCFFSFTTVYSNINSDEKWEIHQKLNNILRVSQTLPLQKKDRIIAEVKSIRQILGNEVEEEPVKELPSSVIKKELSDNYLFKSPYFSDEKNFDLQGMTNLKSRIRATRSYDAQLELIKKTNVGSAFTVEQILELTKLFHSSLEQKEVALVLLPNAVDLENIDQLYGLFSSVRDKNTINKIADDNLH